MALLALPLIDIFILLGIFTAVFVVFRIIARSRQNKALNDYQQSTSDRLMELDSLKSRNLISDTEHEEKRKQILQEFFSRTARR
jgi:hypothetical protein